MASSNHTMEESDDCSSTSTMRQILRSCQAARRRLQERVSALEDNLNYKKSLLENHQTEARTFDNGLKKCIEDKAAVAAKCAKLENEMIKLTMPQDRSAKNEASTVSDKLMALRHVKLENQLGQTEVSMSTEELKNCTNGKDMIALASNRLENLMENTRKLAAEFASFKTDFESMIINIKRAEEEEPTGVADALFS
ncbi:uncharacterized protein [Elaeis guineensis]|uniref:Uncharacterized protein LOC105042724 isoform X2 n=1 Tax=Elaeis guineensis var. tenera TaxID=51953 RepID=A0A8N4F226_ELAGV|nr:uncharacterized protein LOC105042724 isoform X2 [Elaeis guineensis]